MIETNPESSKRTALERLYSTSNRAGLPPSVSDVYPKRMDAWLYLGAGGSCPAPGPGISYRRFDWESGDCVALEIHIEWGAQEPVVPIALYHLRDAAGILLYIGITTDPAARFTQHSLTKPWWPAVAEKSVAWLEVTRQEALAVEATAIRDERPLHNGKHNSRSVPFSAADWPAITAPVRQKANALADLIRAEITAGRWLPGLRVPDSEVLAGASGVSLGTANRAYGFLKREGVLLARIGHGTFVASSSSGRVREVAVGADGS